MAASLSIVFVLFPRVTQLDLTGPLQVFSSIPGASIYLAWKRIEPVPTDSVLTLMPTTTFAECPQADVICVPGGYGVDEILDDDEVIGFLRRQAGGAKYITSVCTGSLALGAAGLLDGYRAATHWSARECLPLFGATLSTERVCIDRNRVTGGGVTAGIDFALTLVAHLLERRMAELIQLRLEYNPAPPFNAGGPEVAPADVLTTMLERIAPARERRAAMAGRAAERLKQASPA